MTLEREREIREWNARCLSPATVIYGKGRTTLQQLEHWAGIVVGDTNNTKEREAR